MEEELADLSVRHSSGDLHMKSLGKHATYSGTVLPCIAAACLGAILFGYHLGVVNGALKYIAKDLGFAENTALQGWVVGIALASATIGSFTGGAFSDKFGRRRTLQLAAIPLVVGSLVSALAQSIQAMITGRLLAGVGIGITSSVVPLYISEVSPTDIRGALGSVNQISICMGILIALVAGLPLAGNPSWKPLLEKISERLGKFSAEPASSRKWRTMFGISVIPAVLMILGMAFSPESPRWLTKQGKLSEAEAAIKKLWGRQKADEAMFELRSRTRDVMEEDVGWFDLFRRRYRKVVSVGIVLFAFQQLSGINAVVYYSTSIFQSAGIASDIAASSLVGAANVIGTVVATYLMDKQGRKKLLITSFTGMGTSMLLLSITLNWKELTPHSGLYAVLGTVLFVLAFSLGAGPVPALLLPEIFASNIRAKAVALSLGVHWVLNFAVGLSFLNVMDKFGISFVYLCFSGVSFAAVIFVMNNVVETKGRSLEEIEKAVNTATSTV